VGREKRTKENRLARQSAGIPRAGQSTSWMTDRVKTRTETKDSSIDSIDCSKVVYHFFCTINVYRPIFFSYFTFAWKLSCNQLSRFAFSNCSWIDIIHNLPLFQLRKALD